MHVKSTERYEALAQYRGNGRRNNEATYCIETADSYSTDLVGELMSGTVQVQCTVQTCMHNVLGQYPMQKHGVYCTSQNLHSTIYNKLI